MLTMRIELSRAHALEHRLHRSPPAAAPAHRLAHGAVDLNDPMRRIAGSLVQFIDVLRDKRVQLPAPLQRDQRQVARVGLRLPCRMSETAPPGVFPHLPIGKIVLQRRELFRGGIPGPHALRPAEVGYPRIGGNSGSGQHDHALCRVHPTTDALEEFGTGC